MICPTCKHPMLVVEYQKIELDYCENCHGTWFDAGELEMMLGSAGMSETKSVLDSLLRLPSASTREKKHKCPICHLDMKKIDISTAEHVIIDACVREDGLWFDGGEVDHLITYLRDKSPDKSITGKVFNFVKEVFQSQ